MRPNAARVCRGAFTSLVLSAVVVCSEHITQASASPHDANKCNSARTHEAQSWYAMGKMPMRPRMMATCTLESNVEARQSHK